MYRIIADRARELAVQLAQRMSLEVVEVEFVKENAEWHLRVYIDKRGGVNIDDCESFSKEFSTVLDGEDMIDRAYNLVVSSPGLDRPLKTEADFRRYAGELLDIRMLPGRLKTSLRAEQATERRDLPGPDGSPDAPAAGKGTKAARKKPGHGVGGPDMISGILENFDGRRIFLTDENGDAFSLAWEDIKTTKRAIRF